MLEKCYIYNEKKNNLYIGELTYDRSNDVYSLQIDKNLKPEDAPFIMRFFMENGEYTLSPYWSKDWVIHRVIPHERQNILEIMRGFGMVKYNAFDMLLAFNGRFAWDSYYVTTEKL